MNIEVTCSRLQKGRKRSRKSRTPKIFSQFEKLGWKIYLKEEVSFIIVIVLIIIINLHAKYLHDFSPMQHKFNGFEYGQQEFLHPNWNLGWYK